jgi:hypothetical protein
MTSVTIELPEALAQRADHAARVMRRPVPEVLTALLEGALPALDDVPVQMRTELIEMTWSSDHDLEAITHLTLSHRDQARLVELSAPVHPLSPKDHQELQRLRERYGEITLRKARAFALLSIRSGKKLLNSIQAD